MFWIYADDKGMFLLVQSLHLSRTKNINKASFWINNKQALTWQGSVKKKFPNMELKKATLKLIE
jgi:hypothetical protein